MNWVENLFVKLAIKRIIGRLDEMGKGWRTIAIFVLSLIGYVFAWPELTQYLDPQWIATGTAVIAIIMRLITNTPVGNK